MKTARVFAERTLTNEVSSLTIHLGHLGRSLTEEKTYPGLSLESPNQPIGTTKLLSRWTAQNSILPRITGHEAFGITSNTWNFLRFKLVLKLDVFCISCHVEHWYLYVLFITLNELNKKADFGSMMLHPSFVRNGACTCKLSSLSASVGHSFFLGQDSLARQNLGVPLNLRRSSNMNMSCHYIYSLFD